MALEKVKARFKAVCPPFMWKVLSGIRSRFFPPHYYRESYSQEGEDLVLERFLEHRSTGFYVDIGAHHPQRFSNTYRLYLRGWKGINVDALPGSMTPFHRLRPRDINVEAAVGGTGRNLTFYAFNEPALNTFDPELAAQRNKGDWKVTQEIPITMVSMAELLDKYLPRDCKIDVLTVDVEGFDLAVLQSNDWCRYQPEFILTECLGVLMSEDSHDPMYTFLTGKGYEFVAKTMNTVIYKRK